MNDEVLRAVSPSLARRALTLSVSATPPRCTVLGHQVQAGAGGSHETALSASTKLALSHAARLPTDSGVPAAGNSTADDGSAVTTTTMTSTSPLPQRPWSSIPTSLLISGSMRTATSLPCITAERFWLGSASRPCLSLTDGLHLRC